jgi:hypothetical protein
MMQLTRITLPLLGAVAYLKLKVYKEEAEIERDCMYLFLIGLSLYLSVRLSLTNAAHYHPAEYPH